MSLEAQPSTSTTTTPLLLLRPRREPFEHGLLPIPKLIFSDQTLTQTLNPLKHRLLQLYPSSLIPLADDPQPLADELHIPLHHARLLLDALAAVLPHSDGRGGGSVDVVDLLLFLYIQSYKRLLSRSHKDSSAVADVWPSTSAFDGYLSALSPIQLVRSNTRRFMPSQADEEAHQLSYLQKHMANILSLLADSVEGMGEESLVLTLEKFSHLEFLIQFEDRGCEGLPLNQAAPFFANSDPDMPAVPVPAAQVHDWVLENIATSLLHSAEKVAAKENVSLGFSDLDVNMTDAYASSNTMVHSSSSPGRSSVHNNTSYSRSQTFVEGVSKASVVKHASDIKGHSVKGALWTWSNSSLMEKAYIMMIMITMRRSLSRDGFQTYVLNCHDSMIYILAPLRYATVYGCSDATVVLGAIGKAVRVEHCERVQIITAAKRICIANCRECVFFLGVNEQPLILGDNHKIQVAPYNTYYCQLVEHMSEVGIDPTVNRWNEPLVLGLIDPHDSLSHPAGVSDIQAESATCLDPDIFTNFSIPKLFGAESPESTKDNPFLLPEIYVASQRKKHSTLLEIQQSLRDLQVDESRKRDLARALHVHFKDWLYASGNIRHLYCLQND